ncbi:MAG: riboflavin synthase [Deltaproteobacteria bacterium]
MFTGIVQELGIIKSINFSGSVNKLKIECPITIKGVKPGDSIAVNGVCLTVCNMGETWFEADVMPETMRKTSLANLKASSRVNIEPALRVGDKLGGHLVTGHIDGTGLIKEIRKEQNAVWMNFQLAPELLKYIISKGSIAIDGISLTVAEVDFSSCSVSLIPVTFAGTVLGEKRVGDIVNIECDMIGKYIEKLAAYGDKNTSGGKGLNIDFLSENGFA